MNDLQEHWSGVYVALTPEPPVLYKVLQNSLERFLVLSGFRGYHFQLLLGDTPARFVNQPLLIL